MVGHPIGLIIEAAASFAVMGCIFSRLQNPL